MIKAIVEGAPTKELGRRLAKKAAHFFNAPVRLITIDGIRVVFHFHRNCGNMIDARSMVGMLEWMQEQGLVSAEVTGIWVGIDPQGKFFCWCVRGF